MAHSIFIILFHLLSVWYRFVLSTYTIYHEFEVKENIKKSDCKFCLWRESSHDNRLVVWVLRDMDPSFFTLLERMGAKLNPEPICAAIDIGDSFSIKKCQQTEDPHKLMTSPANPIYSGLFYSFQFRHFGWYISEHDGYLVAKPETKLGLKEQWAFQNAYSGNHQMTNLYNIRKNTPGTICMEVAGKELIEDYQKFQYVLRFRVRCSEQADFKLLEESDNRLSLMVGSNNFVSICPFCLYIPDSDSYLNILVLNDDPMERATFAASLQYLQMHTGSTIYFGEFDTQGAASLTPQSNANYETHVSNDTFQYHGNMNLKYDVYTRYMNLDFAGLGLLFNEPLSSKLKSIALELFRKFDECHSDGNEILQCTALETVETDLTFVIPPSSNVVAEQLKKTFGYGYFNFNETVSIKYELSSLGKCKGNPCEILTNVTGDIAKSILHSNGLSAEHINVENGSAIVELNGVVSMRNYPQQLIFISHATDIPDFGNQGCELLNMKLSGIRNRKFKQRWRKESHKGSSGARTNN